MKIVKGFTLIELITIIVILSILATVALPKFIHINKDARSSVVQSLAGTIISATNMIHNKATVNGQDKLFSSSIQLENGTNVPLTFGYPVIIDDEVLIHNLINTNICIIDHDSSCIDQENVFEMVFIPTSQLWGAVKIQDTQATQPNNCFLQVNNATYRVENSSYVMDEPMNITTSTEGC